MSAEQSSGRSSSWLVHPYAITAWFAAFLISIKYQQLFLAAFFIVVFIITISSFLWSKHILSRVTAEVHVSSARVFPGQEVVMGHHIENRKFWPLIWIHWVQPFPESAIIVPVDMEELQPDELDELSPKYCYSRKLAWLMWYNSIKWQSTWKAGHRGIYNIYSIGLTSGDGFGLSSVKQDYILKQPLKIVVYPALVSINLENIFNQYFDSSAGANGLIEDPTLNKGIRNFQNGDPWKRINWRLASTQKPLQVNIYETMKYDPVFFIVDAKSFLESPQKNKDFEDALSILASVLTALAEKHIDAGLYVPYTGQIRSQYYPPNSDDMHLAEMLEALSGLSPEQSEDVFSKLPDLTAAYSESKVYIVSYGLGKVNNIQSIFNEQKDKALTILTYQNNIEGLPADCLIFPYRVILMKSLKLK